jgi:DNA-binding transcriptional regulator YhcF (GntR family)/DNA-binding transcriptional MerR regulator
MKTNKMKIIGIAFVTMVIGISLFLPSEALSQRPGGKGQMGGMHQGRQGPQGPNLSEEQKAQLQELVQALQEDGKSREEIKQAVDALFAEWGIEKPEGPRGRKGKGNHEPQLSKEQRAQLDETVQTLKDNGATQEEIRAAVEALFEEWGIEKPDGRMGHRGHKKGLHGALMELLDENQQAAVKAKVEELKAAGASREEIHEAVAAMLADWGIEIPERPVPLQDQLTEDQINTVKAEIERMKEEGNTREEIHAAMVVLYAGFGLELPDKPPHNKRGHLGAQLTEEQRTILHDTVAALKEQGASREEIRAAVKELLEQWKGEAPEEPTASNGNAKIKARNFPNPFNPTTRISFQIEEPGHVSVDIFNTNGQLIRSLLSEYRNPGLYEVNWNALNDTGNSVPTGMYFYKITVGNESLTQRMLFVK